MVVHRNLSCEPLPLALDLTRQRSHVHYSRSLLSVFAFIFIAIAAYWGQTVFDESIVQALRKTATPLVMAVNTTLWPHVLDTN